MHCGSMRQCPAGQPPIGPPHDAGRADAGRADWPAVPASCPRQGRALGRTRAVSACPVLLGRKKKKLIKETGNEALHTEYDRPDRTIGKTLRSTLGYCGSNLSNSPYWAVRSVHIPFSSSRFFAISLRSASSFLLARHAGHRGTSLNPRFSNACTGTRQSSQQSSLMGG